MSSTCVGVACLVIIDPTPEDICLFDVTAKKNVFFIRTVKVPNNVINDGHMYLDQELDIFTQIGICESRIRSCIVEEVV